MDNYVALINPKKYKEQFLDELIGCLSRVSGKGQVEFRRKFESNLLEICKHPTIDLNETQIALINKVEHMLFYRGGLKDVLSMLQSFSRGTKRLRSNYNADSRHENHYEYTDKDGNEKLSHKGNLKKAHFRWNDGGRYTLTDSDINNIHGLINPLLQYL